MGHPSTTDGQSAAGSVQVIVGSETWPTNIDTLWRRVVDNDHLIGDFTWTGWDYLGEVGLGRLEYEGDPEVRTSGDHVAYPWRYAGRGDIDITGYRLPVRPRDRLRAASGAVPRGPTT